MLAPVGTNVNVADAGDVKVEGGTTEAPVPQADTTQLMLGPVIGKVSDTEARILVETTVSLLIL